MSTVAVLPALLRDKLAAVARRIRWLRAARGVSVLALTLLFFAAAALAADAWLDLPAVVRSGLFLTWIGLGVSAVIFSLLVPLCRRMDAESLAALVEQRYRDLGERLTSSVELSGDAEVANGSPALIGLLVQETTARTGPLDFLDAIPGRRTLYLAIVAGLGLVASGIVALALPGRIGSLCERFLFAGQERSAAVLYTLAVSPGNAVAARGRPLTLTARVEPQSDRATLPRSASLIVEDAFGNATRLPMVTDGAIFSLQMESVAGDFTYRAEAGGAVSPDYRITTVEPINVAAAGPTWTITPPAYARATFQPETLTGFHDITALQHSRIRLRVRFTQTAREAVLVWPADKKQPAGSHALTLATDRMSGEIEVTALADGPSKLVLKGENGFDTELAGGEWTVRVDQPPIVVKFANGMGKGATAGSEVLKAVLPYDSIPLDVALADDVGVASAQLEYRVNDGPVQREEIDLQGRGTTQASGRHVFQLGGKVKERDEVQYRLRISDNRDVPEAGLKPQVVFYPAERWLGLKIAGQTQSLAEQEIQAQRDDFDKRLDRIKKDLEREQRAVYKLRQETRTQPSLLPEQTQELKSLRQENEASREALDQLAREAAEVPELHDVANLGKEVADEELRRSEKALTDAATEEKAPQRQRQLNDADKQVASALSKLEAMRRVNDRLAKERMDQAKLEAAAKHEEDLARRAEDLAAKDPIKDASAKPQAEQLQREQKNLVDDLDRAANQSGPLQKALEAARAEETRPLGDKARELAREERKLADAPRDPKLQELARKQRELADKAAKLAQETQRSAQTAQAPPLKPEDAHKAAEALKQGDAAEALKHQDQAANELQRLARDLDRAAEKARDPKEAARQLAQLQKQLQQRLNDETRKHNGKPPPAQVMKHMEPEQKAIAEAAKALSVPPRQEHLRRDQKEAVEQANKAAGGLCDCNGGQAAEGMEKARQALKRLADQLPSMTQRRQDAAAEVERLRQKQKEVGQRVDEMDKLADKGSAEKADKQNEAARTQKEIADRLEKLDAPKDGPRQRAQEAVKKAQDNLKNGKREEIAASQQKAREELKRLRDALAEKQQPSENSQNAAAAPQGMPSKQQAKKAGDLARQQQELRDEVRRLTDQATRADQTPQEQLEQKTGKLAEALSQLGQELTRSPQMQQAVARAGAAAKQAQAAMQLAQDQARQGNQGQARQSQQQAAQMLDRAGRELAQAGKPSSSSEQQTGHALQQAQQQMGQAQEQLSKGQAQGAQRSMQQAAQSLQQAAKQLARKPGTPKQGGQPNPIGAAPGGRPDEEPAVLDPKKYAGKRWGELPGQLQTKIIQDLKAKYGDDYSRIIKLYFEEIADTKVK
jgi:hypothetical protein